LIVLCHPGGAAGAGCSAAKAAVRRQLRQGASESGYRLQGAGRNLSGPGRAATAPAAGTYAGGSPAPGKVTDLLRATRSATRHRALRTPTNHLGLSPRGQYSVAAGARCRGEGKLSSSAGRLSETSGRVSERRRLPV